jgi:hypothetical protein
VREYVAAFVTYVLWRISMYKVAESIRSTHSQDGAVLLDIRQGRMFNLNPVGSQILELLKAGSDEPSIVEKITQKFAVSRRVAEDDVREFIESLKHHNILECNASSDRY